MKRSACALALLLAALGLLAACGDDGTVPYDPFDLTVRVVDGAGKPVAGLDLMVVMDSPYYQDGKAADKARTSIEFVLPRQVPAVVTIEDAGGAHLRTLMADTLTAGVFRIVWDGKDDDGEDQYSGLYYVRLVAGWDPANAEADLRQPMYLAMLDYDQATLGTTDSRGEIVLRDRRLFPALYGDVDMHVWDENGDDLGPFPVTSLMRFYLRDPGVSAARYDRDVVGSGQVIELVWSATPVAETAPEAGRPPVVETLAADDPLPQVYDLKPPYPNPFN